MSVNGVVFFTKIVDVTGFAVDIAVLIHLIKTIRLGRKRRR
jgi:hypothetical protein